MRLARLVRVFLDCVAQMGKTETVEALIAKGAKVDAVGKNGVTPLHSAALSTPPREPASAARVPMHQHCAGGVVVSAPRSARAGLFGLCGAGGQD